MQLAYRISNASDGSFSHKKTFICGGVLNGEWRMQAAERRLLASLSILEACPSRRQPWNLNLKEKSAGSCHLGLWKLRINQPWKAFTQEAPPWLHKPQPQDEWVFNQKGLKHSSPAALRGWN